LYCAELAGVPHGVIQRSYELIDCLKTKGKELVAKTGQVDRERKCLIIAEKFYELDCEKGDVSKFLEFAFAELLVVE